MSGVEQALANFDTVFNLSANYSSSDRPQNFSSIVPFFPSILQRDDITVNAELQKRAATGTQLFLPEFGRPIAIYPPPAPET